MNLRTLSLVAAGALALGLTGCNLILDFDSLGSTDASETTDGSGLDAAQPGGDAGLDAGTPDVGSADVGSADVGTPDVGSADVGSADVGTPDVGSPDVGSPDVGTPDATPVTPTNGLIGEWLFTGNANDTTTGGNNGTVVAAAALASDRFASANSAYSFNGAAGYVYATSPLSLNSGHENDPFTFSVWFMWLGASTSSGSPVLMALGNPPSSPGIDPAMSLSVDGKVNISHNGYSYVASRPVSQQWWHHLAFTFSGSLARAYVDGTLVDSKSFTNGTGGELLSGPTVFFGAGASYSTNPVFNGVLDDGRIYNRALSDAEIGSLFHERGWALIPTQGLVGEWLFDDADVGTVLDTSGKGNNGTLHTTDPSDIVATADRFGALGKAWAFKAASHGFVAAPSPISLPSVANTVPFSLSVWFKWDGTHGGNLMEVSNGAGGVDPRIAIDATGHIEAYHFPAYQFFSTNPVTPSVWHHAVQAFSGSSYVVYLDGQLLADTPATEGGGGGTGSGAYIYIGNEGATSLSFPGAIDDCRVYDRFLTLGDVQALYHVGGW